MHDLADDDVRCAGIHNLLHTTLEMKGRFGDVRRADEVRCGGRHTGALEFIHFGRRFDGAGVHRFGQFFCDEIDGKFARFARVLQGVFIAIRGCGALADAK